MTRQASPQIGPPFFLLLLAAAFIGVITAIDRAADAPPRGPHRISCEKAHMDSAMGSYIDPLVAASIARGDMSGCVVLIGRRDGIVFERAYGNRRVEPNKEPMTVDTLFDMASLTKPLATATSVMILLERGQLRLRDKVSKFFPEFAAHGKGEVTIENLLTHSSGLVPDNPLSDYSNGWKSALPKICDLHPLSEPGAKFKYSDINFILLGKIVEKVSGKPENEFVKQEIYSKLGMRDTGYLPAEKLQARAETTEKRDGKWLKGEVHDPRAAKMGGVAGHAGLFSTAHDLAIYGQMMLQDGCYGDVRILSPATVHEMTRARDIGGQLRALGWDKQSVYSRNRGELMRNCAFGHGGFTGTSMWIDPQLDLYVIFLGDRLHPDGVGEVNDLAGRIGTIACAAIRDVAPTSSIQAVGLPVAAARKSAAWIDKSRVRLGIDVLQDEEFKSLAGKRVGLITNQTGVDSEGVSTIDRLFTAKNVKLVELFSPEHGIRGALDQPNITDTKDQETGLPVYSLFGKSRKPSKEQLAKIDALVFDIQDVGARFYTYPSTMCLAMEAAAEAGKEFCVLDRPNPIDGVTIEGPLLDAGRQSFVGHQRLPVRHGMTVGELARMYAKEHKLNVKLTVVPTEGWHREMLLYDTGLDWLNPSPNMRSLTAALLYPGVGLLEFTNVSVGRGTDAPFEVMGAPWIHEHELADLVNAANPPGVRVVPLCFTPTSSKFAGQKCHGLNFIITDWDKFRSFDLGVVVAHALNKLYGEKWHHEKYMTLLGNEETYQRIFAGDQVADILKSVDDQVKQFRERRKPFLLY
ncbi:MAG TPA: exo-beta-N-acetylmuramidase NamZ domain-containing protein [Lacipirellulaceae bacterium]|nr:exo-beta-N-acetylmuramidase NamZ domain-containing protein [Lacipirellulaceae bacterium]